MGIGASELVLRVIITICGAKMGGRYRVNLIISGNRFTESGKTLTLKIGETWVWQRVCLCRKHKAVFMDKKIYTSRAALMAAVFSLSRISDVRAQ